MCPVFPARCVSSLNLPKPDNPIGRPVGGQEKRSVKTMITVLEAESIVARSFVRAAVELCPLLEAHGAVLQEDIATDRDYPPFDRVTMDGYALRADRVSEGRRQFRTEGVQKAGEAAHTLQDPEGCVEVMTGAPMPAGTDCVVRVEDTDRRDEWMVLADGVTVPCGHNVHRKGSDLPSGATLLRSGTRLLAPQIAAAASVGKAEVRVSRRPQVAILTTGDELVPLTATPAPHQIRMSNVYALRAALLLRGITSVTTAHLRDDEAAMRGALGEILRSAEVLLITGGVSMGKYDFVPGILEALGVTKLFHKVSQRPGKPLWFGVGPERQVVFALPGNPVSALVCAHRYVFPQLDASLGMKPEPEWAQLAEPVKSSSTLTQFLPVRLASSEMGTLVAAAAPTNGSGDFSSLAESDGFVELPQGSESYPAGYAARVYRWFR